MASTTSHDFMWKVLFYLFAGINWMAFLAIAIFKSGLYTKPSEQQVLQFAIARDKFWNLTKQPLPGFHHGFLKIRTGHRLHYIYKLAKATQPQGDLVIFIHGSPDSSMMWRTLLKEPVLQNQSATFICVDLPGFGGSDSLGRHGSNVLEALAEFVIAMRDKYTPDNPNGQQTRTFIVGHDFGAVCGFRLAAEAPRLADHFILCNGPHIELGLANKDRMMQSSQKIFKQFTGAPRQRFACLSKSFHVIYPLLHQIFLFGYIAVLGLPPLMVKAFGLVGNRFWIRAALLSAHGSDPEESDPAESLASTLGPSISELETGVSGAESEMYGLTLQERAQSPAEFIWTMTSYYRDQLSREPWDKSIETIADLYNIEVSESDSPLRTKRRSSSASSALFGEQYKGSLGAPATILWGQNDIVLSKEVCLDGIGDYLARGSEVILLPNSGHWIPVEKQSRAAVAKVIALHLEAGHTPVYVTKSIEEVYPGAVMMTAK